MRRMRTSQVIRSLCIFFGLLFLLQQTIYAQTAQNEDLFGATRVVVLSAYIGQMYAKGDYSYAPTIMLDGNIYKMWWCGNIPGQFGDHILYSQSAGTLTSWTPFQSVLQPTNTATSLDSAHTCDPSVVKVGSTYYMYYTAVKNPDTDGTKNQIFLATSSDGIQWTKYPSNDNPQPVIPNRINTNCYGTGQSSVLYKNGKFWQYYSDINPVNGSTGCQADAVDLATSSDGIHWTLENNGDAVYVASPGTGAVEVKYSQEHNIFFMAHTGWLSPDIFWNVSLDGIHWKLFSTQRTIAHNGDLSRQRHNLGLIGSPTGGLIVPGSAIYGDGPIWNPSVPGMAQWQLTRTDINVLAQVMNSPTPSPSPTATPTPILGDFFPDRKINYQDLLVVIAGFRQNYSIFSYGTVISQYGKVQ